MITRLPSRFIHADNRPMGRSPIDELDGLLDPFALTPAPSRRGAGSSSLIAVAEQLTSAGVKVDLRYGEDVRDLPDDLRVLAEAVACEGVREALRGCSSPVPVRVSMTVMGEEVAIVVRSPRRTRITSRGRGETGLRRIASLLSRHRGTLDVFQFRDDLMLFASFPLL